MGAKCFEVFLVFTLMITNIKCSSSNVQQYCTDLTPQNDVEMDDLMGMWFGTEVLTHHDHEVGEFVYDSCIMVHLTEVTNDMYTSTRNPHDRSHGTEYYNDRDRDPYNRERQPLDQHHKNQATRYLRLVWDEKGVALEYTLRFNNSRRGFWLSVSPQHGTMLDNQLRYNQFTGTIQVIKAVGNHIVLTFCQNLPSTQLFSIVLTRHPNELKHEEIQSVRSLLRRRGLSTNSVRKVCRNGSNSVQAASLSLLTLMMLAFILKQ